MDKALYLRAFEGPAPAKDQGPHGGFGILFPRNLQVFVIF